jgi:hypothetical protein
VDNDDEGACYSVFHTATTDSENSGTEPRPSNESEEMVELFTVENPNISSEEKEHVYEILTRHKKLFANGKHDLGEIRNVQRSIDTGDSPPIRVSPRRIPHHQRETARRENVIRRRCHRTVKLAMDSAYRDGQEERRNDDILYLLSQTKPIHEERCFPYT